MAGIFACSFTQECRTAVCGDMLTAAAQRDAVFKIVCLSRKMGHTLARLGLLRTHFAIENWSTFAPLQVARWGVCWSHP